LGDRSKGIKRGFNGFLIGYELCQVELWFLACRVGSVRGGVGLSWAASRFARGEGRPASARPHWAAPEWEREMAGWAGLGFQPGFGPQPKIELKIIFIFPNLFIICKLI
jgi:hypothetical protein